jgi:starch synthase
VNRALEARKHRKTWQQLQQNGMTADYSWKHRAGEYAALYNKLRHNQ